MKIRDTKAYRETYEQWMKKQAEINAIETALQQLESEAATLKQRLDDYKMRRSQNEQQ